jgi:hypothetical protein
MAEHRETFGEDVGGKLLLLASMLAVFGIVALILMPLGTAFAPPPTPPAAADTATPGGDAGPAPTAPANGDAATPAAPEPAAAPAGPPAVVGALMPGIIMLVVAGVLAALAGLLLGHAKARAEEAGAPQATPPH